MRRNANYDQLSYGQLNDLRKRNGYHKKDAEAVLRTRLEAVDAAEKKAEGGSPNDMDLPTAVFGKRARDLEKPRPAEATVGRKNGKRPRRGALEIALKVDLDIVRGHA